MDDAPWRRTRLASALVNRSKTWSRTSAGTPGPLSQTVTTANPPSARRLVVTRVPTGVWVRALASRLASTWSSW